MDETRSQNPVMGNEFALLLLLATLWGASYTFIKLGVATIPPITLIAARTSIAGVLLLVIMRWRGSRMPRDAATWRRFLFQACLNSVIPFTLIAWAERSLDAGLATILNSTSPIFTFLLTLAITRHEALTARKLFGVVAGMAGICLIVGGAGAGWIGRAACRANRHRGCNHLLRGRGHLQPRVQGPRSDGAGSRLAALWRGDPYSS